MITIPRLYDNYQEVVITQWYCSYHVVLCFDVWLHCDRSTTYVLVLRLHVYHIATSTCVCKRRDYKNQISNIFKQFDFKLMYNYVYLSTASRYSGDLSLIVHANAIPAY